MRYTEARLSKGAGYLLTGLDHDLVDFAPNFDESEKEPVILPAKLPFLLINGTTGIAVGMTTNIPPHNAGEVIDGTIALLNNPDISTEKLMKYIPGPDFPTGGQIMNADDLKSIYETGEGRIRIRAKYKIEDSDNGRKSIVITEIPFTASGNKTKLVENIMNLMKDRVFDEIYDVRDESSADVRIVIEVKKGRDIANLINGLFQKTGLEDTYSVNMLAVKDKQPVLFSLKAMLTEFLEFNAGLYIKEYTHQLDRANKRLEVVEGLIKAVDVIDLIIETLRGSENVRQAKTCLIEGKTEGIKFKNEKSRKAAGKFDFTENQADAILAMPLQRLIGLEILKLKEEDETLLAKIDECNKVLSDKNELHKVMKNALKEAAKALRRDRRTELENLTATGYVEEIKEEDIYVLIDRFGYAKAVDTAAYGKASEDSLNEYTHHILMKNTDKLCMFTAEGSMHQIKAMDIPRCRMKDKGTLVHNLSKVGKEEVLLYTSFSDIFESMLFFVTKQGYVKLVSGAEFDTNRSQISASKLSDGDRLAGVTMLSAAEMLSHRMRVVLITRKKMGLSYNLDEVSEMKKTGRGVKGISLDAEDYVKYAAVVTDDAKTAEFEGDEYRLDGLKDKKRGARAGKVKW